jgi:hypothetical protein
VTDEVRPTVDQLGDVFGVACKVDAPVGRRLAEPAAIDQQETVVVGKWPLVPPRLFAPTEAAMHEDGRISLAPDGYVNAGRGAHAASLRSHRRART